MQEPASCFIVVGPSWPLKWSDIAVSLLLEDVGGFLIKLDNRGTPKLYLNFVYNYLAASALGISPQKETKISKRNIQETQKKHTQKYNS